MWTAEVSIPVWGIALAQEPQLSRIRASYHADFVFGNRPRVSCVGDVGSVWTALWQPRVYVSTQLKGWQSHKKLQILFILPRFRPVVTLSCFNAWCRVSGQNWASICRCHHRHLCLNSRSVYFSAVGERVTQSDWIAHCMVDTITWTPSWKLELSSFQYVHNMLRVTLAVFI